MRIRILKPGLLSSIQDLGRRQYLSDAVPLSGAVDAVSARIANLVLGNAENAATIEFTYAGAEILAETDLTIAWSGQGATLIADKRLLPSDRPVLITTGTVIKLEMGSGCRTYLAVAGGWDVPEILGSRSTYFTGKFGGLEGRALRKGDRLSNGESSDDRLPIKPKTWGGFLHSPLSEHGLFEKLQQERIIYPAWSAAKSEILDNTSKIIRIIPAREFTEFSADSLLDFLSVPYKISDKCNRMACYLQGKHLERNEQKELLSTAVSPGTIQVTHSGQPVLLLNDCQVTGGYPRIAQVAEVDLPLCGQLKPGDEISFEYISRRDAEKLLIKQEQWFRKLKATLFLTDN